MLKFTDSYSPLYRLSTADTMPKNRLLQILEDDDKVSAPNSGTSPVSAISKFGVEQILNIHNTIETGLNKWEPNLFPKDNPYDPLVAIAKLAFSTDDDNLKFKCHSKLAEYKYPQVRSLEINAKEDKEIHISIEIAGYARSHPDSETRSGSNGPDIEIEPEDIEIEEVDERQSYVESVLGQANKKVNSLD